MFDVHRMKIGGIRDFFPSPGTAEKIWPTLRRATPPNHATVPAHPTFDEIFPKWSLSERWKSWEKIRRIRHVSIFQMKITRVWMKIQLDGGRWCPLWPMSSSWQRKCKWISTVWWSVTYRWMCGPQKKNIRKMKEKQAATNSNSPERELWESRPAAILTPLGCPSGLWRHEAANLVKKKGKNSPTHDAELDSHLVWFVTAQVEKQKGVTDTFSSFEYSWTAFAYSDQIRTTACFMKLSCVRIEFEYFGLICIFRKILHISENFAYFGKKLYILEKFAYFEKNCIKWICWQIEVQVIQFQFLKIAKVREMD